MSHTHPAKRPLDAGDPYRYGVYLRPDARTCRAVTVVTDQLRAQYGLVSAGAFPPHATLVGSQPFGGDIADVEAALTTLLRDRPAFDVHNAGVREQGIGYVYDVAERPDGSVNQDFVRLAADVDAAVAPFRVPMHSPLSNDYDPEHWRGHLSLASHDLYGRPDLHDEVGAFIRDLGVDVPSGFRGDTVVLYRTASPDWSGRWWHTMTWEHVRTWTLA
ncbi:2'-5' RNA ligase family protein [Curtobacterium sp. VKM Ac-2922]|uniref:2'-5' RNA ligase family protein n=1 Tax=Curtobacterium sp. VKM Ac-2922 TaxID=2929475 RepID=UPI001FB33A79|nr:2'-5' RNA ligase family protein [Curtobacterium sp. VKM Ac-2922]MCJ1715809.1 heme utilization protein [Curtobacterium sp. VKM Ac-2922]